MKSKKYLAVAFVMVAMADVGAGQTPQTPVTQQIAIAISNDSAKPVTFTLADLKGMPRTPMKVTDDKGTSAAYDGVLVAELLRRSGVASGPTLKGKALSSYVAVTARDGYQVIFSLAELDPDMSDNSVLIADTMDGAPLSDAQGPLRVIAPRDKHNSRWVRQVEKIEVVQLRK